MNLADCRRVILFGGSFDPPHVAHVALPMLAMAATGADAVAFIPAGQAPHKPSGSQTDALHRLAMLRLAVAEIPHAIVLTDEIDRAADGRPSFTIDTLAALRGRAPDTKFRLLLGADMLRIFPTWREPQRIVELAEPLVMVRPPDTRDALLASLPAADRPRWSPRLLDLPQIDASSTQLRDRATRGESLAGLAPPAVEDYIRRHGLYR